jgi:hypothetical protein
MYKKKKLQLLYLPPISQEEHAALVANVNYRVGLCFSPSKDSCDPELMMQSPILKILKRMQTLPQHA